MRVDLEPTEELTEISVNGNMTPCRIWVGATSDGIPVEVFVLSIVPKCDSDAESFEALLPDFFKRTRDIANIGG